MIAANIIIATGEITLSPMGMSLVNRLAPPRLEGLEVGWRPVDTGTAKFDLTLALEETDADSSAEQPKVH